MLTIASAQNPHPPDITVEFPSRPSLSDVDGALIDALTGSLPIASLLIGAVVLAWGMVLLIKKMTCPPGMEGLQAGWGKILLAIMSGGGIVAGGSVAAGIITGPESDDGVAPSPSPSPTTAPSNSAPPADPIVIPTVQNPEAIGWWVGGGVLLIGLVVGLYFFLRQVKRDRLHSIELENQRREAELEAKRIAEQEARRKREEEARLTRIAARWATITELHESLKQKVVDAETDWDTLFDLPALTDTGFRPTRLMHAAMREAELAVVPMPPGFDEHTDLESIRYVKKVRAFESAWDKALTNARKVGTDRLPDKELRTIANIRQLLILAEGSGTSPHERHTAYSQIGKLVKSLQVVKVPARAFEAIESKKMLALAS